MRRRKLVAGPDRRRRGSARPCAPRGGTAAAHRPSRPRTAASATQSRPRASTFKLPPIRHVFVIVLENENYAETFGDPSADPYLARRCPAEGALLEDYYATGHESNDNYISLVSGQPPNPENQADCQFFDDFRRADAQLRTASSRASAASIPPPSRTSAPS